jgi:retron-type reverse transcriptase
MQTFNKIILDESATLHPLNDSFIVLIPKKNNTQEVGEFRPISLVNMIQKIFSKIMASILQPIITNIISPTQTCFIRNRNITEGFIYAQEVITRATKQNHKLALFKANIYKDFDTILWKFTTNVMQSKGMLTNWTKMVQ